MKNMKEKKKKLNKDTRLSFGSALKRNVSLIYK